MGLQMPPAGTALGSTTWPHRRQHAGLDEVRYAHPGGSNTRDGLTWGTAKADVVSAFDALPTSGGTIYIADGTYADSVNTDRGLWLVGGLDPSYASPPTGWRQHKRLRLIGHGLADNVGNGHASMASFYGGSGTDRTKPLVWVTGSGAPTTFENLRIVSQAVAVRLGLRADGTNTTVNTANIVFRNSGIELNQIAGNGPAVELGHVFWLWFYDCVISGNPNGKYTLTAASIVSGTTARFTTSITHAFVPGDTVFVENVTPAGYNGNWQVTAVAATTFDAVISTSPAAGSAFGTVQPTRHYRRAAIAHDTIDRITAGSPVPAGLFTISDSNFNGAGVHYAPNGATTSGRVHLQNITHEGDFGSNPQPPTVHFRTTYQAAAMPGSCTGNYVANVELADGTFPDGAVLVDGVSTAPNTVTAIDAAVVGNALSLGNLAPSRRITALNAAGVWGHVPAVARAFGPAPVPYTNLAAQDASTWGSFSGTATVTTGKSAPDGTALAARLNAAGNDFREIHASSPTWAIGDWVIAGVWRRFHSGSASASNVPIISAPVVTFENSTNFFVLDGPKADFFDDGGWCWTFGGQRVTAGSGAGNLLMQLRVGAGNAIDYYAPVLIRVPVASVVDDDDMRDFIRYFRTWPDGAPAGSISTLLGQKLIARGGLGVGNSAAATTPGSVVKKMEVFSETGASLGFVPIYSSIT